MLSMREPVYFQKPLKTDRIEKDEIYFNSHCAAGNKFRCQGTNRKPRKMVIRGQKDQSAGSGDIYKGDHR